jgi:hypothetical protein
MITDFSVVRQKEAKHEDTKVTKITKKLGDK